MCLNVHMALALSLVPPLLLLRYRPILLITRHLSWFRFIYQMVMLYDIWTTLCCGVWTCIVLLLSYHLNKQLVPVNTNCTSCTRRGSQHHKSILHRLVVPALLHRCANNALATTCAVPSAPSVLATAIPALFTIWGLKSAPDETLSPGDACRAQQQLQILGHPELSAPQGSNDTLQGSPPKALSPRPQEPCDTSTLPSNSAWHCRTA